MRITRFRFVVFCCIIFLFILFKTPLQASVVAEVKGLYFGEATVLLNFDGRGSSDPDGSIVTYSWDFGDGSYEFGSTLEHRYDEAGVYLVLLKHERKQYHTCKLKKTS